MTVELPMGILEICKVLPHRFPFLLIDRIIELEPNQRAVGIKNVTYNEPFFVGHFPDNPVMPGVLIVEAMAQVGGVLGAVSTGATVFQKEMYFMGMDKVRFRKTVVPGDQLVIEATIVRGGPKVRVWRILGKASVGETVVAEADMMAMLGGKE